MRVYAARDKKTGKFVSDITNPRKKYWDKKGACEGAINRYNTRCDARYDKEYDLECVEFELVEVKK